MQVKDFKNKYFKTSALPDCSGCGKNNYLRLQNRFRCRSCLREYSLFKGTVLEKNHLPLEKWLKVIQRYSERTIAARALANLEGIRYPTALRMLKTFRSSNLQWQDEQALEGEIEIDEVFLGFNHAQGRAARPIIVLLCEKTGKKRVIAAESKDSKTETLLDIIEKYVKPGSHVITDAHGGYNRLQGLGYKHTVYNIQASKEKAHRYLPLVHSQANQLRVFFKTFVKPPKEEALDHYLAEFSWRQSFRFETAEERKTLLLDCIMKRGGA